MGGRGEGGGKRGVGGQEEGGGGSGVEVEEVEEGLEEQDLGRINLGSILPMAVLSQPSQS